MRNNYPTYRTLFLDWNEWTLFNIQLVQNADVLVGVADNLDRDEAAQDVDRLSAPAVRCQGMEKEQACKIRDELVKGDMQQQMLSFRSPMHDTPGNSLKDKRQPV